MVVVIDLHARHVEFNDDRVGRVQEASRRK